MLFNNLIRVIVNTRRDEEYVFTDGFETVETSKSFFDYPFQLMKDGCDESEDLKDYVLFIKTPLTKQTQYDEDDEIYGTYDLCHFWKDKQSLLQVMRQHTETTDQDDQMHEFICNELDEVIDEMVFERKRERNNETQNKTNSEGDFKMENFNVNEMVKTGVNGETLVKGKNGGFYKIMPNGTLARELYVFENIAPIQKVNVQELELHNIIAHETGLCYVSAVSETTITITNFATLTSVNMAVLQADGLDTGFTKLVNPITFQIDTLKVKARDLLATVSANVPKLQVAVEFANSDNMELMTKTMVELLAKLTN